MRSQGHGYDDVVLTVPAQAEFGDVAQRAAGELARRQGFDNRQWSDLETAVGQTLRLLREGRGERIRFRFVAGGSDIAVEAELTGSVGGDEQGACAAPLSTTSAPGSRPW